MRTGTAASFNESKATKLIPVNFVMLDFSSGPLYMNSSPYSIDFDGNTYLGVGNLGAISVVQEGTDLQARGIELTLSGIPSSLVAIALDEAYQGRDCKIWIGFLTSSHDPSSLIADPIQLGPWIMDTMDIELGETAKITVRAESRLIRWDKPHSSRYTNEEQQNRFPAEGGDPADLGLEFVSQMAEKELLWGRTRG